VIGDHRGHRAALVWVGTIAGMMTVSANLEEKWCETSGETNWRRIALILAPSSSGLLIAIPALIRGSYLAK